MTKLQELPYRRCVGITLVNEQGNIWAGQRVDNPSEAWQMPQGGVVKGEDIEDAAYRELCEETGIGRNLVKKIAEIDDWLYYDLPPEILGKIWKGKYRGQRQKWFLYRYLGNDEQVVIKQKNQEFRSWKWMTSKELIASVVPFKRDVYCRVFDAFSLHITC